MGYQYDVFLSYNRKFPHGQWVDEIFYPLFVPYLEDALNKEAKVFKDTKEIEAGSAWPQRLKNAIAHSRCMVSIFSPAYFRSQWCMKEFNIMYYRQKQLGYLTVNKPTGLIFPVNIFDGEHFPPYAHEVHMLNCIDYNRIGEGVKRTKLFVDFQGVLQGWVYDVAKAINKAPEWDKMWLTRDWLDIPFQDFQPENESKMRKPNL
jgi:hypothetical protein